MFLRFQNPVSQRSERVWNALRIVEQTPPGVDDGMPHGFPMSDFSDQFLIKRPGYLRKRNDAPLRQITLAKLRATQDDVERAGVEFHILHPQAVPATARTLLGPADKPIVVLYRGELHIIDGHHRLTALRLKGETHALVRLVDLDTP